MRTNNFIKASCLLLMASASSAFAQKMSIEHKGDTTVIKVENPTKYLLLPVQEEKDEAQVLLDTGSKDDTWMDVRLAQNGADYYVPFALGKGKTATVKILGLKNLNSDVVSNLAIFIGSILFFTRMINLAVSSLA